MKVFKIVVSVDSITGRKPIEVTVSANDIKEAKQTALAHASRIGYENPKLGFPPRTRKKA